MTVEDAALEHVVAGAQGGDPEVFERLFDHYHELVYRYIVTRLGRPSDAENLTQLVFVKALEALARYEQRGVPFGGWLFRLARNVAIDFVRNRREHTDLDVVVEQAAAAAGPDDLATLPEELDAVAIALRRLTDEQREAMELRFFAGLSARKAAGAREVAQGRDVGRTAGRGRQQPGRLTRTGARFRAVTARYPALMQLDRAWT